MNYRYFLLALITAAVVSCKDDATPPVLTVPNLSSSCGVTASYHEATIEDTLMLNKMNVSVKLFYSTDSLALIDTRSNGVRSVTTELTEADGHIKLTSKLSYLTDNTTYYYMYGFISPFNESRRGGLITKYSVMRKLTTLENKAPEVKTVDCNEVGFFIATVEVEKVSDNADSLPREWGICYSTEPNVTVDNWRVKCQSNDDSVFSSKIGNLTSNTTYYYRAYGVNKYGTSYGEEKSFTTVSESVMSIETEAAGSKGRNFVILSCNLRCDEGVVVADKGFCFSKTNATPTTDDSKVSVGGGTSSFQGTLNGLTAATDYYVRAYVECQYGKLYGNVVAITTEE